MVKVTLESGTKKLPNVSIVAMKRSPSTGRIVNQEWWTVANFSKLIQSLVHENKTMIPLEVYDVSSLPSWVRWVLGKPQVRYYATFDEANFVKDFKTEIQNRLEEDLN
jgi:hypothetical protein